MVAPANTVQVQGQGSVSADMLNTYCQWCPTVAVLRTFTGTSTMTVQLLGLTAVNDGGEGSFYWNSASTATDDGTDVIRPTGLTVGAWIRLESSSSGTVFPSGGTTPSQCGTYYVALAAFTLQLPHSTGLNTKCVVNAFAYGGDITVSLASGTDDINEGTPGASLTIPQGYSTTISTDGAGNFYATVILSAAATGGTTSTGISSVSVLKIKNNAGLPNTQVDVTASTVYLASASLQVRFAPFSKTINAATTGANALDTGSLASSTWYYIYIIAGIQTGSVIDAALLSASSTSPTLPSGYTMAYRVGAIRTDGSTHFEPIIQYGNHAQVVGGAGQMVVGIHGDPNAGPPPTWFTVDVTSFIPPTAGFIDVIGHGNPESGTNKTIIDSDSSINAAQSSIIIDVAAGVQINSRSLLGMISTGQIFYASNDTGAAALCAGWVDNI